MAQVKFNTMHEVPRGWRTLDGYPLSLDQVTSIIASAHQSANGNANLFASCLNDARVLFRANNHKANGVWVAN